ncbi:MAG: hypothetical protein H0W50_11455 [Parachlamydiaceae bacterium]|nr:hypothetical protein [Parachlamydiaceae bacterium]
MKRRIALINLVKRLKVHFPIQFEGIDMDSVEFYIDVTNPQNRIEIVDIIDADHNRNTFRKIVWMILNNRTDTLTYRREGKSVTAMKFSQKGHPNTRIYCKDIPATQKKKRKVVMARVFRNKTTTPNNKKNQEDIDAVINYEYEFFKNKDEAKKYREQTG